MEKKFGNINVIIKKDGNIFRKFTEVTEKYLGNNLVPIWGNIIFSKEKDNVGKIKVTGIRYGNGISSSYQYLIDENKISTDIEKLANVKVAEIYLQKFFPLCYSTHYLLNNEDKFNFAIKNLRIKAKEVYLNCLKDERRIQIKFRKISRQQLKKENKIKQLENLDYLESKCYKMQQCVIDNEKIGYLFFIKNKVVFEPINGNILIFNDATAVKYALNKTFSVPPIKNENYKSYFSKNIFLDLKYYEIRNKRNIDIKKQKGVIKSDDQITKIKGITKIPHNNRTLEKLKDLFE